MPAGLGFSIGKRLFSPGGSRVLRPPALPRDTRGVYVAEGIEYGGSN
jgi:hypothetical protein